MMHKEENCNAAMDHFWHVQLRFCLVKHLQVLMSGFAKKLIKIFPFKLPDFTKTPPKA